MEKQLIFEPEKMNEVFMKYHIRGLPFDAVLHHFSQRDLNEHIHDHPFAFTTYILKGSYVERVYEFVDNGDVVSKDIHRRAGESHRVIPNHIHEIIDLPDGECFTLILPEKWEQEVYFYRFENGRRYRRKWDETEYIEF